MAVQAQLSDASIVVAPGGEETVRLAVRNLGPDVETFAIVPSGFCAGWVTVSEPTLALLPGEEQIIAVTLRPPRAPSVASGASVLALRVVPHGQPTEVATVEASVTVLAFANRQLTIAQPVQVGTRRSVYDVVLENRGNDQAVCRLSMTDLSGRLVGRFDPPSLLVDAGQSASAQLRVRAKGRRWFGRSTTTRFTVEALQDGEQAAISSSTFVQAPLIRSGAIGAALVVILLAGAIAAAWSLLIRPAIDDAAADAVADLAPGDASPPTTATPIDDGGNAGPTVPSERGAVFNVRLPVSAAAGKSGKQTLDAPETVEISDLVVQNPDEDLGTITISAGDEILFTFDLETVYGYEQVALQTPIVVAAGSSLLVSLDCDAPGDPAVAECSPSVFLSGRTG